MVDPSQSKGPEHRSDARRKAPPGEDPGTLTDEEYLSAGGPDALDSAAPAEGGRRAAGERDVESEASDDEHPDSPPDATQSDGREDPERPGAAH